MNQEIAHNQTRHSNGVDLHLGELVHAAADTVRRLAPHTPHAVSDLIGRMTALLELNSEDPSDAAVTTETMGGGRLGDVPYKLASARPISVPLATAGEAMDGVQRVSKKARTKIGHKVFGALHETASGLVEIGQEASDTVDRVRGTLFEYAQWAYRQTFPPLVAYERKVLRPQIAEMNEELSGEIIQFRGPLNLVCQRMYEKTKGSKAFAAGLDWIIIAELEQNAHPAAGQTIHEHIDNYVARIAKLGLDPGFAGEVWIGLRQHFANEIAQESAPLRTL